MTNINTHKAWDNFKEVFGNDTKLFWHYVSNTDHCPGHSTYCLTKEHIERIERLLQPNYRVILKIWKAQHDL